MVITPDDSTLIVAESYSGKLTAFDIEADGSLSNRRTWADLGDPPDGICIDAEGAVWCPSMGSCVRVREGGEELNRVAVDRGCFSCTLGGPEGKTLHILAAEWHGPERMFEQRTGQVLTVEAPAPHGGRP
jgi:sugar lactone lactonase YvrE